MAWTEQILDAAYTSPNGTRMTFGYAEEVSRTTALKTAENTFPDLDGAEIQSLGLGGKKFPMTAIFSGADCMTDADAFEELLCERGYGILEHPIYGKHTVVPTGDIARTDNLVSALNESRVKVIFSETLADRPLPESEVAAEDALDAALEKHEEAAAESFAELIETDSVDDEIQLQSVMRTQTNTLFKGTSAIAEQTPDLKQKQSLLQTVSNYKENVTEWIGKVDKIAANAIETARVVIRTARIPSQIAIGALAKIEGYASIITDTINNVKKDPVGAKAVANQFAATITALGGLVAAMSSGVAKTAARNNGIAEGGFYSRADILLAADSIIAVFGDYVDYMDSQISTNSFVDTGTGYTELLEIVISSVQLLQTIAFDLPITRTITLGRDRQLIELLCELYGIEAFDRLDQFIIDNNLTADELVLLPMGREVRYYG